MFLFFLIIPNLIVPVLETIDCVVFVATWGRNVTCSFNEIYCNVTRYRRYQCLHNMFKCNGERDCENGEDELDCGEYELMFFWCLGFDDI